MNPLARPPLDYSPDSPVLEDDLPPSQQGTLGRFLSEVSHALSNTDVRRLLWEGSRILPNFTFARTRARLLTKVGCDIRPGTAVFGHVKLVGPRRAAENLKIGTGCVIAPGVTLCLDAPITLGKNVSLGPGVTLYTATHPLGLESRRMAFNTAARAIVVEDGAWIGLGALILAGVRVGRGAVVAAGSVVNSDVPDNALVSGNPATIVEELPSSSREGRSAESARPPRS
jgi:acetyltransferase-like isoleucine patch superfamily enzyme